MSCAMRRSPRGSIQRPKRGKKLKMPPRINIPATMTRIQNLDGSRSQRMKVPTFVGTRRSINAKYLFSPNMTEAMPNPIRVSVKEPHRKMLLGEPNRLGAECSSVLVAHRGKVRRGRLDMQNPVRCSQLGALACGGGRHVTGIERCPSNKSRRALHRTAFLRGSQSPGSAARFNRLLTLCSLRESGCQQIGGRRVCLTVRGHCQLPLCLQ